VLFIGDSYTHAVEVSRTKTYYEILATYLPFECFAYGAAGYGTLQEYLLLEKYMNIIDPDNIILQLCSNDIIDNYSAMEKISTYKVGKKRPYLNKYGDIIYETPLKTLE